MTVEFDKVYNSEVESLIEVNNLTKEEVTRKMGITLSEFIYMEETITHEKEIYDSFYQDVFNTVMEIVEDEQGKEMKMFPRLQLYNGNLVTELTALRLEYGLNSIQVYTHPEVNISSRIYSRRESGKQSFKVDEYEQFFYELSHALPKIAKDRRDKIFNVEMDTLKEDSECNKRLEFAPITPEVMRKSLAMLSLGKTFINVAVHFGVDEQKLLSRYQMLAKEDETYKQFLQEEYLEGIYI